jgi:Na+/melibiose symporter-like transporter
MDPVGSTRQKILYCFGQFGNGVYNGFNNAILSLYVSHFTSNAFIIDYLGNTRTVEGVVIQPLVGRWSDRTTNRLGRRRPFILFGIPVSVFFLLLIPVLAHSKNLALPLIAASIILFSITWNIAGDPYQALMVDITPPEERSVYNAILSVVSLVGQVVILVYASLTALKKNNLPNLVFYACAAFLFLSYAVVFFGVREPKKAEALARVEERIPWRVYLAELREFREAFKLLVSIFFLWTGLNAIQPLLTVYTKKVTHSTDTQAILVYLALILAAGICAYPFGRLATRYGYRRLIVIGTLILILAALVAVAVKTYIWLFPVAILGGAGFSATTALTYPYLASLVPESRIGAFTGLQTAFSACAAPVSVAFTGVLIGVFGYRTIWFMLAVLMVFDVLFLLSIDEPAARMQVSRIEEQERLIAAHAGAPAV